MASNTQQTDDSTGRQSIWTALRIDYENGAFHATEPEGDHDLVGRGDTRTDAVRHYCDLIDEIKAGEEPDA